MRKKVLWLMVTLVISTALVLTACAPAPGTTTAPATTVPTTTVTTAPTTPPAATPDLGKKPVYGGTLTLALTADPVNWDPVRVITGFVYCLTHQKLMKGDWAKGPAGGFGTAETDWGLANNQLLHLMTGNLAESMKWTLEPTGEGTIVFQIRKGVRWQLPDTAAGRLVNGREMTTDDVVYSFKRATTIGSAGFVWTVAPDLRDADIRKTGPQEVTIKSPSIPTLLSGVLRFGGVIFIVNPEVVARYGDLQDWRNFVGTGPFMLTDYVAGSQVTLIRNPNYWERNPVGPGKGDRLPYLDRVKVLVVPDASTRLAALRTGKIDYLTGLSQTDAEVMRKTRGLIEKWDMSSEGRGSPLMMRTDKAPFNDIRVRQAMMLATDFQEILRGLYGGAGHIVTTPFAKAKGYEKIYLGLEDPDFPAEVRELYNYNPAKARQLLKEAGYPNGFKTTLLLPSTATDEIDYYSVIKSMWNKVGIDFTFDLRELAAVTNIRNTRTHEALAPMDTGPVGAYMNAVQYIGRGAQNLSMIDDPVINEAMLKVRTALITSGDNEAMRIFREEVSKYALRQVYVIPRVLGTFHAFYWPWLKNYSGELTVGFDQRIWPQYIWVDEDLKRSMGYK